MLWRSTTNAIFIAITKAPTNTSSLTFRLVVSRAELVYHPNSVSQMLHRDSRNWAGRCVSPREENISQPLIKVFCGWEQKLDSSGLCGTLEESCPAVGFRVTCGEMARLPGTRAVTIACEHSLTLLCGSSWFSRVLPTSRTPDWNATTPVPFVTVLLQMVFLSLPHFFITTLSPYIWGSDQSFKKAQRQIKT